MEKVTQNIIANYAGKLWGFISIFIFVRFYIDLLGIESYAIINFYTVILGLLAFADAGLTATLTRQLARDIEISEKSNLVYTFEKIYFYICLIITVVVICASNYIANNFLQSKLYTPESVSYYLRLIGIGVALQLFSTLYEGGLNGLQHQVLTNKVKIVWSLFRSGLVLIPIYFYPKLDVYFIWQILCNIVLILFFRNALKTCLSGNSPIFSLNLLKSNSRYALGMMGIALISAINIQIDKLVTSKYLSMEQFGYYSIASTLSQVPTMIVIPVMAAVFPLFSLYVSQNNNELIGNNFHKYSFLITIISAPISLCLFLYSIPLVELWIGKPFIAESINNVLKILVLGSFFLCLQLTPFYLALANGYTKINLYTGVVGLIVVIPLIIYSVKSYGMIGATIPWLLVNVCTFLLVGFYIVNKFLNEHKIKWIVWDILVPILLTFIVGFSLYTIFSSFSNKYVFLVSSMLIGLISIFFNVLIYNKRNIGNPLIDFSKIINFRKS
ncbi:hypothetical protein B9T33_09770 [Acinetobacter sp. ANC 5054]|uniref:lipopolysaccharide biosynthesis protein n=1 Tax=Acinetobacter sp. ANC 5054 TaxID=1977877 RepID=UPI000A33B8A8|nr:oligosaccharide flippase family protein [Acinetobacter sp. ANC 5054]OTG80195.1 hypothetical protein B9T33_09770 [Acinetobacter sp. ANC 5054]